MGLGHLWIDEGCKCSADMVHSTVQFTQMCWSDLSSREWGNNPPCCSHRAEGMAVNLDEQDYG